MTKARRAQRPEAGDRGGLGQVLWCERTATFPNHGVFAGVFGVHARAELHAEGVTRITYDARPLAGADTVPDEDPRPVGTTGH
ncbi:hypothetical protein [Streptomyces venetus]|uniref:hypothetical protein n=1 Tax=Streptomyces venetus TaxID=1701086 RepID=UPI003C2FFCA0